MLASMGIRSPKWLVLAALVLAAPDTPGVYELWDDDELLRIGVADKQRTLRSVLTHELLEGRATATHFQWEISFDPVARQRELIAELEDKDSGGRER
jgi:hypothetical protein